MAPLDTTITRSPPARTPATSPHSFSMAPGWMVPLESVSDDVPILATTSLPAAAMSAPALHLVRLIFELEPGDGHPVAGSGPGAGQRPVHAKAAQASLGVGDGLGIGEVGQGDRPLRGPSPHGPASVGVPFDSDAFRLGPVHDEADRRSLFGA